MSGIDYLADTNAIIYLLGGNACMKPFLQKKLAVSVITFMELLSFSSITVEEEKSIRQFLNLCEIFSIDEQIREKTIELRKINKIKLPDSIIAATAITKGVPLLTADTGFLKISGLQIKKLNP